MEMCPTQELHVEINPPKESSLLFSRQLDSPSAKFMELIIQLFPPAECQSFHFHAIPSAEQEP